MHTEPPKLFRYHDLKELFQISRSSLSRWEAKGIFPRRIKIGQNSVGWRADEVQQWFQKRSIS